MRARFDNSYTRLPARLYARQAPTPVRAPELFAWNAGLADRLGIAGVARMAPGRAHAPSIPAGSLAFDGERELTFTESDQVSVRLVPDAFRTIDVPACMAHAAAAGLFIRNPD